MKTRGGKKKDGINVYLENVSHNIYNYLNEILGYGDVIFSQIALCL
jgi:hypothetical protein